MATLPPTTKISILGATGATGSNTLRALLAEEHVSLDLRIYVRSKQKLMRLLPELASRKDIHIWEGELTDVDKVTECLSGAEVIIDTIGENRNMPGLSVLQSAAKSIVAALRTIEAREGEAYSRPRLLLLSSSTWNARLAPPPPAIWLIKSAFYHSYADLLAAQAILAQASTLLRLLLVQPPAIIDEPASGFELTVDKPKIAVSYPDLGAAFAELAMNSGYDGLSAIGVTSVGGASFGRYAPEILSRIFWGLLSGFMPGYWWLAGMLVR
ncbi:hypothetical protein G7054_g4897 [Neopestalotiopsis clavispora]|nr:hypothetical protein G7054_g4897 [Neopestalotiopsis clavispora]